MANKGQPNPGRGFRIVTKDGKEKFVPVPMPLAQPADLFPVEIEPQPPEALPAGEGQPPSEPPAAPPEAMEPAPEPEYRPVAETKEAKIARLEREEADLVAALYWIQTQLAELKETSAK